ncbi:MAG: hypothetical protein KAT57_08130, partial [Candidatus Lokiarchaeota archaeon]|nr:hypothetical protein [Candidatus Lokiarchaeota archaeon]
KTQLYINRYFNGQLAVFLHGNSGEPIAELSIMHDLVELAPNEFILKDYSENKDLANEFFEAELINTTDRFILVGSHLCPICQIES